MLEFAAFRARSEVCIDANEHELANQALEQLCASGLAMNCVLLTTLMKGFIRVKRLDLAMNLYDQTPRLKTPLTLYKTPKNTTDSI